MRKDHRGPFGKIIKGKEVLGSKKVFRAGNRGKRGGKLLNESTTLILN